MNARRNSKKNTAATVDAENIDSTTGEQFQMIAPESAIEKLQEVVDAMKATAEQTGSSEETVAVENDVVIENATPDQVLEDAEGDQLNAVAEKIVAEQLTARLMELRAYAIELGIAQHVSIEIKRAQSVKTTDPSSRAPHRTNAEDKNTYTVELSGGEKVQFASVDDKAAKYRAYRIAKDGSKTREPNQKVASLTSPTGEKL